MNPGGQAFHLTAATPEGRAGKGASAKLGFVNVNTASASATVTIYQGPFPSAGSPSTNGTVVAVIDASSSTGRAFEYDVRCNGGVYAVLAPAATGADVTVTVF